jgi:hypothetical protein
MRTTAAALIFLSLSVSSHAQGFCPEGRTSTGACVKPELASGVRQNVLVFTQPKISYTAPPVLPSQDGEYAVPRDTNELRYIYGIDRPVVCTGGGAAPVVCQ